MSGRTAEAITRFLQDCDENKPRGAALSPSSTSLDWEEASNHYTEAVERHSDRTVERFKAKFGETVRQVHDALAAHGLADDLDRFRLEHPANIADLHWAAEQLRAAAAPPPVEDRFLPALREHIESGRGLDTSEPLDPQTGLPPVFDKDPLYEWARGAWRFLREHRYEEAARDFKGADDSVRFESAFKGETSELGRDRYRNRCVRVLEALCGIAPPTQDAPLASTGLRESLLALRSEGKGLLPRIGTTDLLVRFGGSEQAVADWESRVVEALDAHRREDLAREFEARIPIDPSVAFLVIVDKQIGLRRRVQTRITRLSEMIRELQ